MKELEEHAEELSIEIIILQVFSTNENAIHVYSKMEYLETGRIPRGIR
jgi:ribosomal protein S18 acetylase RimI-like enzyme